MLLESMAFPEGTRFLGSSGRLLVDSVPGESEPLRWQLPEKKCCCCAAGSADFFFVIQHMVFSYIPGEEVPFANGIGWGSRAMASLEPDSAPSDRRSVSRVFQREGILGNRIPI